MSFIDEKVKFLSALYHGIQTSLMKLEDADQPTNLKSTLNYQIGQFQEELCGFDSEWLLKYDQAFQTFLKKVETEEHFSWSNDPKYKQKEIHEKLPLGQMFRCNFMSGPNSVPLHKWNIFQWSGVSDFVDEVNDLQDANRWTDLRMVVGRRLSTEMRASMPEFTHRGFVSFLEGYVKSDFDLIHALNNLLETFNGMLETLDSPMTWTTAWEHKQMIKQLDFEDIGGDSDSMNLKEDNQRETWTPEHWMSAGRTGWENKQDKAAHDYQVYVNQSILDVRSSAVKARTPMPFSAPFDEEDDGDEALLASRPSLLRESEQQAFLHEQHKITLNEKLNEAFANGHMIKWFPLHSQTHLNFFRSEWANFRHTTTSLWNWMPLKDVYDYFGEEIGFYFEFLQHYSRCLALPALFGIYATVLQIQDGNADLDYWCPVWIAGLMIWGTVFMAMWLRREKEIQYKCNVRNFDSSSQGRANQRMARMQWNPKAWKFWRFFVSWSACVVLLALDLALIAGLLILRWYLVKETDFGWTAGIIQGITIVLVNILLKELAIQLTELENHMTNHTFEKHLVIKCFTLEAANSYVIFFVVAFVKKYADDLGLDNIFGHCYCETWSPANLECDWNNSACTCLEYNCMEELRETLLSIFVSNLVIGNIIEFGIPMLCGKIRKQVDRFTAPTVGFKEGEHDCRRGSVFQVESDRDNYSLEALALLDTDNEYDNCTLLPDYIYHQRHQAPYLSHYDGFFGTFEDMNEMAIQFGFLSMFSVAFPAASLLAFLNNVIEMRSDANKLCSIFQRPWPQDSPGLGVWNEIFQTLMVMAIITNVSLLVFTSKFGDRMDSGQRVMVFIFAEHFLFLVWVTVWKSLTDENRIFGKIQNRMDLLKEKRSTTKQRRSELQKFITSARSQIEKQVTISTDVTSSPDLRSAASPNMSHGLVHQETQL